MRAHQGKSIEKLDALIMRIRHAHNNDIAKINKVPADSCIFAIIWKSIVILLFIYYEAMDEYTKHVQNTPKLKKLKEVKVKEVREVSKGVKKLKLEEKLEEKLEDKLEDKLEEKEMDPE